MKKLEKTVKLITNLMREAIKEDEERYNYKWEGNCMKDFLQDIYGDMSSAEFKEEVKYVLNKYDNDNYYNKILGEDIDADDEVGIIDTDGQYYSYKQIMKLVRKEVFNCNEEI